MAFSRWAVAFIGMILLAPVAMASRPGARYAGAPDDAGKTEFISVEDLKAKIAKNDPVVILDLRNQSAYFESDKKIKGSTFMRFRRLRARMASTPHDKEVVTFCSCPADEAAIKGADLLREYGFSRVKVLKGGWKAWLAGGGQTVPKPRNL